MCVMLQTCQLGWQLLLLWNYLEISYLHKFKMSTKKKARNSLTLKEVWIDWRRQETTIE